MKVIAAFIIVLLTTTSAHALREPKPTMIDGRLRVVVYNPEDVIKFTGFFGYQASIEFEESETIDNISIGDSVAWQLVPSGKRLFLKPVEANPTTNMTLITNKRVYHFELHGKEATDINDPEMVFNVKFVYPEEGTAGIGAGIGGNGGIALPDLSNPEKYNFNYTMSGPDAMAPVKVFDDGEFTYMEFRDKNAEVPAIFLVDSQAKESVVNFRVAGKYIVIERVASRFTLRNGPDIVCIFNETLPLDLADSVKKKKPSEKVTLRK